MENKKRFSKLVMYLAELVCREAAARKNHDIDGFCKHYSVKANTFAKLQKIAADAVATDGAELNEDETVVVAWASVITADEASRWLRFMPNKYVSSGVFWSSSVVAFILANPTVKEKVDPFYAALMPAAANDDAPATDTRQYPHFDLVE